MVLLGGGGGLDGSVRDEVERLSDAARRVTDGEEEDEVVAD